MFIKEYLFGIKMLFDTKYDGCKYSYYLPNNDFFVKQFLIQTLTNESVILDIGSNIGNRSLIGLHKESTVHSFEPNRDTLKLQKINVLLNSFDESRIHLLNGVVSEEEGKHDFYLFENNQSGLSSMIKPTEGNFKKTKINSYVLDKYIQENHILNIDFLKIDAEGAEKFIFRGMNESIQKQKIKTIYFETNHQSNESDIKQIMQELKDNDYLNFGVNNKGNLERRNKSYNDCFSILKAEYERVKEYF